MKAIESEPGETTEGKPETGFLEKLKLHKFKILTGILGILVFAGAVFGAYKIGQKSLSRAKLLKIDCIEDSDCVLVINTKDCCSCPTAVNKSELKRNKNLMIFKPEEMGKAQEVRPECKDINCSPCVFLNKAICELDKCKGVYEKTEVDCPKLERLEVTELAEISESDCQKCGGEWGHLNMVITGCNPKTSDVGKACTDEAQCIGVCLASDMSATSGSCSDYKYVLGCNSEFAKGKMVNVCRD